MSTLCYGQKEETKLPLDIKINQIQVLGTHNSYAQPVDSNLLEYANKLTEKLKSKMLEGKSREELAFFKEYHPNDVTLKESLNYDQPSFDIQLNNGVRSLEIDVYHDPTGNRFINPAGIEYLKSQGQQEFATHNKEGLDQPGYKVLHIADLDFRSKYPTLKIALQNIKTWSDNNPSHIPLFILIEAKDSSWPLFKNPTQVLKLNEEAFDILDKEILEVIGRDKIITPYDVRANYPTLRDAITNQNWPLVSDARGKFVFMLLPSSAGASNEEPIYARNRPNLENRVMFVQSKPTDSFGAFLLIDNAIVRQEDIKEYVKKGYLVRSRSDIDTYEAKVNDKTRAKAAFSSGAQVISTDYLSTDYNPYNTPYYITLPDNKKEVRINPINYKK